MNNQEAMEFLFTIAREMKRSFETPVILLTMKDYANRIFNSLVEMRMTLLEQAGSERVASIVTDFHLEWLQAVHEVDEFKQRIRVTPRDFVSCAIDFTIESVQKRHRQIREYVAKHVCTMSFDDSNLIQEQLIVMTDMNENIFSILRDKQKCLHNLSDPNEYYFKVYDEAEELLNWLDCLNDNLAIDYSKVVGYKFPELTTDLSKTLNQVIEEVSTSKDPETQQIVKELETKTKNLTSKIRLDYSDNIKMRNILDKIKILEDRIDRLKCENSSAVMALQHKKVYLEERLLSLENLKVALYTLRNKQEDRPDTTTPVFHIFDHLLPAEQRRRLVDDLIKLWTDAICGLHEGKSIISILSAADIKEIFSDDLGKFSVDKHGRKLYKGSDDVLYQVNDKNELVPINDDDKCVYFYDNCGRYYINCKKERIYKAFENASEYLINREGHMLKLREFREGVDYWYDSLGRYYFSDSGNKVYRDATGAVCEHDGLGNLVRVRSSEWSQGDYVSCPREPVQTEESKYLQRTVGLALKKCLAKVVMHQPEDPIRFLANSLEKYRLSERASAERRVEDVRLQEERERRMREDAVYQAPTEPVSLYGEDEESISYADSHFIDYQTINPDLKNGVL